MKTNNDKSIERFRALIPALAVAAALVMPSDIAAPGAYAASPAQQQAAAVPQLQSTPRPAATPTPIAVVRDPGPTPTPGPLVSQYIRDEMEKVSAKDIVPTPPTASKNVRLTPALAAQKALDAASPRIRNAELQRQTAQRQVIQLQQGITAATQALAMDDRYLELKDQHEKYGADLEEELQLEWFVFETMQYTQLDPDQRRTLTSTRDLGADTFNLNIKRLEYTIDVTKKSIEYAAQAQYAALAKLQAAIAVSREGLELQAAELAKTRRKYELGSVSKIDVDNAELSYKKAELSLGRTVRSAQSLATSFNKLLGENLETTYEDIDLSQVAPGKRVHALQRYLDLALAQRSEILLRVESKRLADAQVSNYATEPYKFSSIDEKRVAQQTADEAEVELDSALQTVEAEIRAAYKQYQALRGSLAYYEEQIAAAEQNLERALKLLDLGLATQSAVDAARMSVSQTEIQLTNVKVDIWLQERKLETMSGIGPGGL